MSVKSKDITEKLTFHEKLAVTKRLLREIHTLSPSFLPLTVIRQFLSVAEGYIHIWVSTMVINEIVAKAPVKELIIRVIIWLGIAFVINLTAGWLSCECDAVKNNSWDLMECRLAVKNIRKDYPELESPYTSELQQRMEEDNRWGNGIHGGFDHLENLSYQLFNMFFAVVMLIPMMQGVFDYKNVITYIFFSVLILMVILNGLGESIINEKLTKYLQLWPKDKPEEINLMWYFTVYDGLTPENRKDAKLYNIRDLLKVYIIEHGKEFLKNKRDKVSKTSGQKAVFSSILGSSVQGICYFFLTILAVGGSVAIGMVVRYVACFERLTTAIQSMLRDSQNLLLVARRQSTTFEYLDTEGVLYQGKLPVEKRSDNEYEIEFRKVSFQYPGSDEYALKNFSLKLRIGEKMAVVGKNGSGKTTMIKLLCRLYDPTEGEILLNGIDIRKFDYDEYMRMFSIVFQDFSLFAFPISKNVAASEEYESGQVEECLIKAGFEDRLRTLEEGINTPVGKSYEEKGKLFSGGECQKIAIARALYRKSPFILLDEPTAALDPIAEFEVYSAFNEMVGNRTAVYISHRLSSCRFCDDIIVFDKGEIIQRGSHEELIKNPGGLYYNLWNAQAKYYER